MQPVYARRRANSYSDILDGSSNTFAIGEISRTANSSRNFVPHRVGWTFGANGIIDDSIPGYVPTEIYAVKSFGNHRINENRDFLSNMELRNSHCYSSNHPRGAIFSLADGSTRLVSDTAAIDILLQFSSIASREAVSADGL